MNLINSKISEALSKPYCVTIIQSKEFFFQKAQEALSNFKLYVLNEEQEQFLLKNKRNYDLLKNTFDNNLDYKHFGDIIFELVSYCDTNAYKKNDFNKYLDKRAIAPASVRMNNWVEQLLTFKLNQSIPDGSIKNAIEYLENPSNGFTILSENHRKLLSIYLLNNAYDKTTFYENVIDYFSTFNIQVANPLNYTHLLSVLCYFIRSEWKESIIGLLACDGTGWQDDEIKDEKEYHYITLWNHKKPTGKDKTIELLKERIEEDGYFKLFYSSDKQIKYVAEIVDLVTNQEELDNAHWSERYKMKSYEPDFLKYEDENKSAKIIYLAQKLYKVEPIPSENFTYYNGCGYPSVGSQTPVVSYITNEIKKEKMQLENICSLLRYKEQIILQGPPGTGKTREAKEIAAEMLGLDDVEKLECNEQFKLIQFHPSYTYEDFVRGIVAKLNGDGGGIAYKVENKILGEFAEEALKNYNATKGTVQTDNPKPYILIIDEINRANLSSVLGELIYALEYRDETVESIYAIDGNNKLILPRNLYIIGTMNTADRSVGHIDYAIRRRFAFVDMLPKDLSNEKDIVFNSNLFRTVTNLFVKDYDPKIDYNANPEKLQPSEYLSPEFDPKDVWLGHSYFIDKSTKSGNMQIRLKYEIKPILFEYVDDGVLRESARKEINELTVE